MKLENIIGKGKKRGGLAISQIILLMLGIAAVSFAIGETNFQVVSAQTECTIESATTGEKINVKNIEDVPTWCKENGLEKVCIGGSGTEILNPHKIECATAQTNSVATLQVPAGGREYTPLLGLFQKLDGTSTATATGSTTNTGGSYGAKGIVQDAAIAGGIATATKLVAGNFLSAENTNSLTTAVFIGSMVGRMLARGAFQFLGIGAQSALIATGIGAAIAFAIFAISYKKTVLKSVEFSCYPWDAPTGGEYCEECNDGEFPCTEYKCRSLGQACELVNKGTTEELCTWVNRGDVNPPIIQPWEETLTIDYKYTPDNTISPPDRGVRIVKESNECVTPFTPLRFGVTLDEPAKCKIDPVRKNNFDDMNFFFGGSSTLKYNHSQTMSLPSPEALAAENITLENGGEFELYTRCQDANGNANTATFAFRFCVDEGPDTTPPLIVTTSIFDGSPISFEQESVDLQVYVNEPSECRWSKLDQSYDSMENQMSCDTDLLGGTVVNAQAVWQCSTTLTGLNDLVSNDFYFRCKDQPYLEGTLDESNRNANTESYEFNLIGTRPLVIDSAEPDNTIIKDSTNTVKVTLEAKTSAGFKEGDAVCYYSETGNDGSFIEFFNTGTHEHSQDLFLSEGSYNYHIRCIDLGGNADNVAISFGVETDTEAPIVVRAFHEENDLKIITNENATCVYSNSNTNQCNYLFEDGITMSTLDDTTHTVSWDSENNFYIKCKDEFENRPLPNSCSIIAKPFQS